VPSGERRAEQVCEKYTRLDLHRQRIRIAGATIDVLTLATLAAGGSSCDIFRPDLPDAPTLLAARLDVTFQDTRELPQSSLHGNMLYTEQLLNE
jgi:hypothetical protein